MGNLYFLQTVGGPSKRKKIRGPWVGTCPVCPLVKTALAPRREREPIYVPGALVLAVEVDRLLGDESVGPSHLIEHVRHPVLDTAVRDDRVAVVHHFALARAHRHHDRLVVDALLDTQLRDVVKHLQQSTRQSFLRSTVKLKMFLN